MAAVCVETGEVREACYLGLAPSSSTTVMLAIGDALALAMAEAQGFGEADFGLNHPAGSLGQRFRYVQDFMRSGDKIVCVQPHAQLKRVIQLVSDAKTGSAILVDRRRCAGGHLHRWRPAPCASARQRRAGGRGRAVRQHPLPLSSCTTPRSPDALKLFQNTQTEDLPVLDPDTRRVLGTLCLKDLTGL